MDGARFAQSRQHRRSAASSVTIREWDDLILGLELNYNRVSLKAMSADSITRSFTDSTNLPAGHNYFYTVSSGVQASLSMQDIAELRARAGWEAGIFLPYAFGGLALESCQRHEPRHHLLHRDR